MKEQNIITTEDPVCAGSLGHDAETGMKIYRMAGDGEWKYFTAAKAPFQYPSAGDFGIPAALDGGLSRQAHVEEAKYYTPALEDLHPGYECEEYNIMSGKWWHNVIRPVDIHEYDMVTPEARQINLRTPYLTRQQIEAEGWTASPTMTERTPRHWIMLCNGDWYLRFYYAPNRVVEIFEERQGMQHARFAGHCTSINEFRKVCQLIGITKDA